MPFRFLFRAHGEIRFQEGTFFDEEANAIEAVKEHQSRYPDDDFGYIEIDDPNGGA